MKYLVVFLAIFGISNAALFPHGGFKTAQLINKGLALKDGEFADIIRLLEGLVEEAAEAIGDDAAKIIDWIYQEWDNLKPYIAKLEDAVKAFNAQLSTDLRALGETTGKEVLEFIADHADQFNQINALVKDAAAQLEKGDTKAVTADIEKIIPLLQQIFVDFNTQLKADIPKFIAWLQNEQTVLQPLAANVLQAAGAVLKQLFSDLQAASDEINQKILDFLKAHQQEIISIWKDVAAILKRFGVDVNVPSDLTPAINDLGSIVAQVKVLVADFQPMVEKEVEAFVAWAKAEYQKMQPMINIVKSAVKAFLNNLYAEVQTIIGEAMDDTEAFIKAHDDEISALLNQIIITVNDFMQGKTDQGQKDLVIAEQMFEKLMDEVKVIVIKRVQEFIDWFKVQWKNIQKMLPIVISLVQNILKAAVDEIGKESQDLLTQVEQFVKDHEDIIKKLQDTIQQLLKDLGFGQ